MYGLVLLSSNTILPHMALFEQLLSLGIRCRLVKGWWWRLNGSDYQDQHVLSAFMFTNNKMDAKIVYFCLTLMLFLY